MEFKDVGAIAKIKELNYRDLAIFLIPIIIFSVYLAVFSPCIATYDSFNQLHQIASGSVAGCCKRNNPPDNSPGDGRVTGHRNGVRVAGQDKQCHTVYDKGQPADIPVFRRRGGQIHADAAHHALPDHFQRILVRGGDLPGAFPDFRQES